MTDKVALPACTFCGGQLQEVEEFTRLPRVTSDSRPFRSGGRIASCADCTGIQKIPDERWLSEIGEIYENYDIYHQSGAVDQPVFDSGSGRSRPRSRLLVDFIATKLGLASSRRALDIGCGNGAFLAALSSASDGWQLFGSDLSKRNIQSLAAIPGFKELFVGEIESIPGTYDLVSMVHSLEHFQVPLRALQSLRSKIAHGGRLFVQVPDVAATPFDLVVADHLVHFSANTLALLASRAGFTLDFLSTDTVVKELSLLARLPDRAIVVPSVPRPDSQPLANKVDWLKRLNEIARDSASGAQFGLFGTSIASVWIFAGSRDHVGFFVDEDRQRVGRKLFGRPIVAPEEVPRGATVLLAFIPKVADAIHSRLRHLPVSFVLPPAF